MARTFFEVTSFSVGLGLLLGTTAEGISQLYSTTLTPFDLNVTACPSSKKQRRFFVDNLMFGIQLADVGIRCSSHPQGISEARSENAGAL